MLFSLASFFLPLLFVFGVYHLLTWCNTLGINDCAFWKRVAITSAVCHVLLASGFLAFSYFNAPAMNFAPYLFNQSHFWRLMTIFDTAPMIVIIAVLTVLDRAGINPPGLLALRWRLRMGLGLCNGSVLAGPLATCSRGSSKD